MVKRKLLLADQDEQYLKELSYYFMENVPQVELITFTKKEKLYQYLEQGGLADILVVDETFAETSLKNQASKMTRLALSVSMAPIDGFEVIKKYQRLEALSNAVLLKYAEENGNLETVRGDSQSKIVAVYSPAGGTGKTTLALAMAVAGARAGMRTLYLNLEEIDSVNDVFGRTAGTLSDVFLALKTKGMNVGIKLKACVGTEPMSGFTYLSGVESISEYEEIKGEDIVRLLESIRELAAYDLVVVDQNSGFTLKTKAILKEADSIVVPITGDEGSVSKMQRFLDESRLHDMYDAMFQKMSLILNKVGANGRGMEQLPGEISNRIPCYASVMMSPVLARRQDILRSGDMMLQVMNPVLQVVMGSK